MKVVDRSRNHMANLLSNSSSSKIPNLASEFRHCHTFRDVIISGLGTYRHFLMSVAAVLTCQNYFPLIRGLKARFHALRAIVSDIERYVARHIATYR